MTYRIFVTGAGIAPEARALLIEHDCAVEFGEPKDGPEDIARKLAAFRPHGLIVRAGRITAEVIAAAPDLCVICKHGVGTDNIDVAAATARGIPVAFTPAANYECVAEHTLALILALLRQVAAQDARIRRGAFDKRGYDGGQLGGKTLGLIGFGKAARRLMELAAPFGVETVVYHPSQTVEELPVRVVKVPSADDVFARAEIVSLHCPLTAQTRQMVDARTIGLMKRGAFLVNTARGGLVNEADLAAALREGRLAGAALDVFEAEPPAADNPLFALENTVFTTHVAGVSDVSFRTMGMDAAGHVLAVLGGKPLPAEALVNPGLYA